MPVIPWCDELSVGYSAIDSDHKRLIELFNEAHNAVDHADPRERLEEILTQLIEYTNWHFDHEKKLMEEHGYDRQEAHMLEHQELAENAKDLCTQFHNGDDGVLEILIPFLQNWLTDHIMRSDKRLGDFLNGFRRREL